MGASAVEGIAEPARSPLIESIGAPLSAVLVGKPERIIARAPTRKPPLGQISGKRPQGLPEGQIQVTFVGKRIKPPKRST